MTAPAHGKRGSTALALGLVALILPGCSDETAGGATSGQPVLAQCGLVALKSDVERYLASHPGESFAFRMPEGGCRFTYKSFTRPGEPQTFLTFEVIVDRNAKREHNYSFQVAEKNGIATTGFGAAYGVDGLSMMQFMLSGERESPS